MINLISGAWKSLRPMWRYLFALWVAYLAAAFALYSTAEAQCVTNTGRNASVILPAPVTDAAGTDTLRAFTAEGLCVGEVVLEVGANQALAIWGDDTITPEKDGLTPGEVVRWRLGGRPASLETDLGPIAYADDGIFEVVSLNILDSALRLVGGGTVRERPFTVLIEAINGSDAETLESIIFEIAWEGVQIDTLRLPDTPVNPELARMYASTADGVGLVTWASVPIGGSAVIAAVDGRLTGESGSVQINPLPDPMGVLYSGTDAGLTIGSPLSVSFSLLLVGDVDGSGTVDGEDLLRLARYFIGTGSLTAEELERADLFPYPAGDGLVNLQDVWILARELALGTWPPDSP